MLITTHNSRACWQQCLPRTPGSRWFLSSSSSSRSSSLAARALPAGEGSKATATATETADVPAAKQPSSSAPGTGGGFLSTPEQQAGAYLLLSGTSVAFGVLAAAAPQLLLSVAVGGDHASTLELAFTRIAGATMAISAAVEYSLQDAVVAGHLKSPTYQRLMLGVIAKSSCYLAAFLMAPRELWTPVLLSFYPTSAAASIAINAATLSAAFRQAGAASLPAGLAAAVGGLKLPQTPAGWTYAVFVLLYLATVAACYAPEVIFTGEAVTPLALLLKHTWAPGFLLAAAACLVLSDAADRGRLGASTFRRLNLGLAVLEAGYASVFGAAIVGGLAVNDGSSISNLLGSVGIAGYCLWQFVSTGKPKASP